MYDHWYKGFRANGWSKEEAAKAARRHVNQLTPAKLKKELAEILQPASRADHGGEVGM